MAASEPSLKSYIKDIRETFAAMDSKFLHSYSYLLIILLLFFDVHMCESMRIQEYNYKRKSLEFLDILRNTKYSY